MNQLKRVLSSTAVLGAIFSAYAQPTPPSGKTWVEVPEMTDEFNNGFDDSKWEKVLWDYPGTPTRMLADNSGVSDGNLWIKATLGPEPLFFESSRIYSKAQISYPMYTECSIITAHLSAYNTFWLNNGNINDRDEIDVIENNSRPSCGCQPNFPWQMNSQYFQATNGFTVRNADNFDNRNLSNNNPKKGVRWNEEYHTVGVWWKDEKNMTFYLDGEEAGSVVVGEDRGGRNFPEIRFSRDLNLIWDLWTDDENFLGGVADKAHLTDDSINTMRVDWVHTYKLENGMGPVDEDIDSGSTPTGDSIVIEAENFAATGGTFNDSFAGGSGLGVNNGGTIINYVNSGDYADYTVNIDSAGEYEISYQISTPSNDAEIQLTANGSTITTAVPNNGSWSSFNSLEASNTIILNSGNQTIRVSATGSNVWQWNLEKITLTKIGDDSNNGNPGVTPQAFTIEAEDFDTTNGTFDDGFAGGPGLGANVTANVINYVNSGDYMIYNINVAASGNYNINYVISSPSDDAQIEMLVDGNVVDTTNVPNNGSWDSYGNLSGNSISLSAGNHEIRINASGANTWQWNLDKIDFTPASSAKAIDGISDSNNISIYPNPTVDNLYIDGLNSDATYNLFGINGASVNGGQLSAGKNQIDLSQLTQGVYFLNIQTKEGTKSFKVIKI